MCPAARGRSRRAGPGPHPLTAAGALGLCEDYFHGILAEEQGDPDMYAWHAPVVCAYFLQHPARGASLSGLPVSDGSFVADGHQAYGRHIQEIAEATVDSWRA